jgi:DNA-damage-inducible protein D
MDSDDQDTNVPRITPFESIRRVADDGSEYWSARELAKILGYTEYGKFKNAISKAEIACESSGQAAPDHIAHVSDMIETGKGAKRHVDNVHLSRYACYLIVQNADPSKPVVALGQTYFAVQTRRQELQEELAPFTEDQLRLLRRSQMNVYNTQLAGAAQNAGVITSIDFAIFQDHGYQGLYGGLKAKGIHARKGLKKSQEILDYMGSDELAANIFRASQTKQKLEREQIKGKEKANRAHLEVGKKVRQTIVELGGTLPENLPTPAKSIQQLQREEQKLLDQQRQPLLFEAEPENTD